MSVLHPPLVVATGRSFIWPIVFTDVNGAALSVAGNSYACDISTAPIVDGGTVLASFTFDVTSAATGKIVASLTAAQTTPTLNGGVWDLKETTPGPTTGNVFHGVIQIEKSVTT